jgi:Ca2+-binding RTX toxin-like protein
MKSRRSVAGLAVTAAFLLALTGPALAAGNGVTPGRIGRVTQAITLNDVKPAACTTGTPVNLVTGSGVILGTNQRDLILGSPLTDTINGRAQNDCIVGGDMNDTITGAAGNDVCIGGPGVDVFASCETVIQ